MNPDVTGAMIRRLRTKRGLTQQRLAEEIRVSGKTVSKWETGRGCPDLSLIGPLADALGVSVIELFSGEDVVNTNRAFNMQRLKVRVCPVCGNVTVSAGEAVVSCCGVVLPALEAEAGGGDHPLLLERAEDEYYVRVPHEMSKTHFISFLLAVRDDGWEMKKLYPEGEAEARFSVRGLRCLYWYCSRHGLFRNPVPARPSGGRR